MASMAKRGRTANVHWKYEALWERPSATFFPTLAAVLDDRELS